MRELFAAGSVRGKLWLASAATALLIVGAAIIGLRGTAPLGGPASQPAANTPFQAALAVGPAAASTAASAGAKPATAPLASAKTPSFDIVSVDPRGQAVIAGRAAPGDRVRV